MTAYPTAQQGSAVYTLTSPDGSIAVLNDATSGNYVMPLTGEDAVTGIDSPEVRSAVYDRIEGHGAIAGSFFHGIRPITFTGQIVAATQTDRNTRINRLDRALNNCMAASGTLQWTPAGGISQFLRVRKYQPQRVRGGWAKEVFVSLLAPDPFIYGSTLNTTTNTHTADFAVENQGNDYGPPVLLKVNGPGTNPQVRRTYGGVTYDLNLVGTLAAGEYLTIDPLNKTILHRTGGVDVNAYHWLTYTTSTWWLLGPGSNTLRLNWGSGATGASTLRVDWRDTWL